jgi:hypothetical protein
MSRCPSVERLRCLLAEQVGDAERAPLEAHVEGCSVCQQTLEELSGGCALDSARLVGDAEPYCHYEPASDFLHRLMDRFTSGSTDHGPSTAEQATATEESKAPAPNWPVVAGYELLGELGKGGMGIVYKARQISLGRAVALKMIRGGDQAHPEQLARFYKEAETLARLRHPGIVQVYEVGEWRAGRISPPVPFFSMELVEGGSLAQKLNGAPLPPRQAAELVQALAQAMHSAHQHGIVHRDLKPANVMLATDGTPKITDFGLAKQLDLDIGQTRSGAIIGTPSYMAPEQAAGKREELGPAVDIYALGAVLYELLTGLPPFKAETPLETLVHVRYEEPIPPRRLNPKVTRDLETICLKCLEKAPQRRYESAETLANDLKSWLAGEPILARPDGWIRWIWRTTRRPVVKKMVAGLLVVCTVLSVAIAYVVVQASVPGPSTEEVEAWRRQEQLEAIQLDLAEGRKVTLIGQTGAPRWSRWSTTEQTRSVSARDDAFSVQSWEFGLLELLPDPQQQHYRFSVEVRHNYSTSEEDTGSVGIYFFYSNRTRAEGLEHRYCVLAFNDLVDLANKPVEPGRHGNPIPFDVQIHREPSMVCRTAQLCPWAYFEPAMDRKKWRRVLVEVGPENVRVSCDGKKTYVLPRGQLMEQAKLLGEPQAPAQMNPSFDSRDALGLYVYKSSASFRDAVVEPLYPEN